MAIFKKKTEEEKSTKEDNGEEFWNAIINSKQDLRNEVLKDDNKEGRISLWKKIEAYGTITGKKVPTKVLNTDYENKYDEKSLFDKIGKFASVAGKKVILQVLVLYYCLLDRDTPSWAKTTIIGALGYFIFPLDSIPDIMPGIGYSDDFGVLVFAMGTVIAHIKEEHKERAKEKITRIFGKS